MPERPLRHGQSDSPPCGLCGGYGAYNQVTRQPVACMACGKESAGLVLVCWLPPDEGDEPDQRGGLRLIGGGAS